MSHSIETGDHKMSKISQKIIITIILCILIVAASIGLFSLNMASSILTQETTEKFSSISKNYANEFSILLSEIESTVNTVALSVHSDFDVEKFSSDVAYRNKIMSRLNGMLKQIAEHTDNIQGIYVVFDPKLTGQVYESWYIYESPENFVYQEPEALEEFYVDNEDMGWYYDPISEGKGVWSMPYTDATINVKMISYTAPIILDEQIIGVAGIDVSFENIQQTTEGMRFYESGYPALLDDKLNIIIHPVIPEGTHLNEIEGENLKIVTDAMSKESSGVVSYIYQGENKFLGFSELVNGWYFMATAKESEINAPITSLTGTILFISLTITLIAVFIGLRLSANITKPLNKLINQTNLISKGIYDIDDEQPRNDEIGKLLKSFQKMSKEIHTSHVELKALSEDLAFQANHDALTSLSNRRYAQSRLSKLINEYNSSLDLTGIMLIDLNDFKKINDTLGHNTGDHVLLHTAEMMLRSIDDKDELFRFGGDEFLLIFKNVPTEALVKRLAERLLKAIRMPTEALDRIIQTSGSIGITFINSNNLDYSEVLRQADMAMYKAKEQKSHYEFYQE